jgi:chromosome segregation ATPase
MELKLNWLQNKQAQLLKDLTECDNQVHELCSQSIAQGKNAQTEFEQHKQECQAKLDEAQTELARALTQLRSL